MIFCKHKWEVTLNDYTPSYMDRNPGFEGTGTVGMTMGVKIVILTCAKCGKLDKTVREC